MIFVDTSFWVALRNRRDNRHQEAEELFRQHGEESLVISNQILGETWTFLRRKVGHGGAVAFLDAIERSPRIQVVSVDEKQKAEALRWLCLHDEREYSFVDATSFAVMRSLRLREALAFDGDFSAAGFIELRA